MGTFIEQPPSNDVRATLPTGMVLRHGNKTFSQGQSLTGDVPPGCILEQNTNNVDHKPPVTGPAGDRLERVGAAP